MERLKEFGVQKADIQKKANEMFSGQETINNKGQITNQENFNKALLAIMEERYTGGAEKLAQTTRGMLSTVSGITKSALAKIVGIQEDGTVKSGTLIDKVKTKVKSLADMLTEWQSNGTLDKIASKATDIFSKVYNVVSSFVNFIVKHKDIIITIGSMAIAFTTVRKSINALRPVINAFKVAWALLNATLITSPIGLIVAGLTILVGAVVLAYQKSETFRNKVAELGAKFMEIKEKIDILIGKIKENDAIMNALRKTYEYCCGVIGTVFGDTFNVIIDTIDTFLDTVNGTIDTLNDIADGSWSNVWQRFKENALGSLGGIIEKVSDVARFINNPGATIGGGVIKAVVNNISGDSVDNNATGTSYFRGGYSWIGEHGPELMKLPSGTKIKTNSQSQKMVEQNANIPPIQVIIQGNVIGNEQFADYVGNHVVNKVKLALNNM